MSEQLLSRVKRLVSGGVNSLVDAVENASPELVMEEATREIDSAIDEVRDEMGRVLANKHLASKRMMDTNEKHEALTGQIDLAVQEGRDDLAEAAIAKQLDLESQIPILETSVAEAAEQEVELERYLEALQARRREMEDELSSYRKSREEAAQAGDNVSPSQGSGTEKRVSKAERAFDRVMKNATGIPGSAVTGRQDAAKLAELEQLARSNRVKERLAAAKARKDETAK